jgi:cbb3-type cytochrome oxidase subunit 3
MKLATSYIEQVSGLDFVSSSVLILMFILFLWIAYRIYRTSKADADHWGNMPLENGNEIVDTKSIE